MTEWPKGGLPHGEHPYDYGSSTHERVEPREGIVTAYDHDGVYVGCIGAQTWKRLLDGELERLAGESEAAGAALRQAATNLAAMRPIDSKFRELAFSDEDISVGEAAEHWERLLREQARAALESSQ